MEQQNNLLIDRLKNPFFQAGLILALNFAITLLGQAAGGVGVSSSVERFPWLSTASFLLLFAIFNSIISLLEEDNNKYWGRSITSFMLVALIGGFMAYLFSGLSIWEAGSYSWIFIVVSIGYLVFSGMVMMMKNIVAFAQREEWNQPRKRHRNNKR